MYICSFFIDYIYFFTVRNCSLVFYLTQGD